MKILATQKKNVAKIAKKAVNKGVQVAKNAKIMDPKLAERANAAVIVRDYIQRSTPQDVVSQIVDLDLKKQASKGLWSFKGTYLRQPFWGGAEPAFSVRYSFKGIVDTIAKKVSSYSAKTVGYLQR